MENDQAFRLSAQNGHLETVKYLIELGANIHLNEDEAFCWSAESGYIDIVKHLVDLGADIHAKNDYATRMSFIFFNLSGSFLLMSSSK